MRGLFRAALLLWLALGLAEARGASYDDFAEGESALSRDQYDAAIKSLTAALGAGDLKPSLVAAAYFGRSWAYYSKDDCSAGLSDENAALKIRPGYAPALTDRALLYECLQDFPAAIADFKTLIALHPSAALYDARGRADWLAADFSASAEDLAKATQLDGTRGYYFLWLSLAQLRLGSFDQGRLEDLTRGLNDAWPQALVRFYAGRSQEREVADAVAGGESASRPLRQCESDFYIGEWRLAHHDETGARELLQRAAAGCPKGFIERMSATVELGRPH
ncbi:MAG TPA: hypothetical protein VGB91_02180 [Rhizomicrobium sp.]